MKDVVKNCESLEEKVRKSIVRGTRGYILCCLRQTLKTCRQFLPLSLSRLSSISMTSTKSFLRGGTADRDCQQGTKQSRLDLVQQLEGHA